MRRLLVILAVLVAAATISGAVAAPEAKAGFFTNQLTVVIDGAGTVTSDDGNINCPSDCTKSYLVFFAPTVVLTAAGSFLHPFASWTDCPAPAGNTCTVDMGTGDHTVTAHFGLIVLPPGLFETTKSLAITTAGTGSGTVATDVAGDDTDALACTRNADGTQTGDCDDAYTFSILLTTFDVTVTATPAPGSSFDGFSGDCAGIVPYTVNLATGDKACTATFTQGVYPLAVSIGGSGTGGVTSGNGTINCPGVCTGNFPATSTVELTATAAPNSTFDGSWGGACAAFGSNPVCTLTMDGPKAVTATFTAAGGGGCTIVGTNGPDVLVGTSGDDVICAKGGNDIVKAKAGNDIVKAGKGKDLVRGGSGDDDLRGQKGRDRLLGGQGVDVANGGRGVDICAAEVKISC